MAAYSLPHFTSCTINWTRTGINIKIDGDELVSESIMITPSQLNDVVLGIDSIHKSVESNLNFEEMNSFLTTLSQNQTLTDFNLKVEKESFHYTSFIKTLKALHGKSHIRALSVNVQARFYINEDGHFTRLISSLDLEDLRITGLFSNPENLITSLQTKTKLTRLSLDFRISPVDRIKMIEFALSRVTILFMRLDQIEIDYLAEKLQTNTRLRSLTVANCYDATINFQQLSQALLVNKTLTKLRLFPWGGSFDRKALFGALRHNTTLLSLELSHITKDDLPNLINMLNVNTTLEVLTITLDMNSVPHDLIKAVTNSNLSKFGLYFYSVQNLPVIDDFLRALGSNQTLTDLAILGTVQTPDPHLYTDVLSNNSTLHSLILERDPDLTRHQIDYIAQRNKTLIDVSSNDLKFMAERNRFNKRNYTPELLTLTLKRV